LIGSRRTKLQSNYLVAGTAAVVVVVWLATCSLAAL
jgi:hypothetical protein